MIPVSNNTRSITRVRYRHASFQKQENTITILTASVACAVLSAAIRFPPPLKTRLVAERYRGETTETKPAAILRRPLRRRHHRPHHLHLPNLRRPHYRCWIEARLWAGHFVLIGCTVHARRPAFCRGLPWFRLDH